MYNGRTMRVTAACPTCQTHVLITGTVRYDPDGTAAAHGVCACGTAVTRPVLGGHLPITPVCGTCKPEPGPRPGPGRRMAEPSAFALALPCHPEDNWSPFDMSAAVRDVALLLADDATAAAANAEEFAALAKTIVETVFPRAAATAFHAAEAYFIEHRKTPYMAWGHDASKLARDWAWEYEATLPEHSDD